MRPLFWCAEQARKSPCYWITRLRILQFDPVAEGSELERVRKEREKGGAPGKHVLQAFGGQECPPQHIP